MQNLEGANNVDYFGIIRFRCGSIFVEFVGTSQPVINMPKEFMKY